MDGYSKMLMLLRNEGAKYNPSSLVLGEMTSSTDCSIGNLVLDADDYYIAEHLTQTVKGVTTSTLKAGDTVLLYPVNDEMYVIITKVVTL